MLSRTNARMDAATRGQSAALPQSIAGRPVTSPPEANEKERPGEKRAAEAALGFSRSSD
jgi:hypothetical protein